MSDPGKHTHSGDGTVPGLHGEPIPTPVLGCPACATVHSIGGELGAAPEGPEPSLADFLLARIAEDEAVANHARWAMQGKWFTTAEDKVDEFVRHNSPARVLAECGAKRRIVEEGGSTLDDESEHKRTMRLLALPHSDHPDYREEWRP